MSTLQAGDHAPSFTLSGTNGSKSSLAEALKKGPVLAAFFKSSCPVCQFTFPFLERLYETYGDSKVTFLAISQDNSEDTIDFCKEYGVKFPVLVDAEGYPASNQFGLTNVPSIFYISPEGNIKTSSIGFSRADLEAISQDVAAVSGKPHQALFRPDEVVPDYKPG